ncbi:MAG: SMC-Scp complex subunit ScpB, partial [Polyangiaceae bacterium]|nr:SMC-Scp complex subunit ScpB [Polyangiaceae bacterium]
MSNQTSEASERSFRNRAWSWLNGQSSAEAVNDATDGEEEAVHSQVVPTAAPASGPSTLIRDHLSGVIEALLFASDKPMTVGEVAKAAKADKKTVKEVLTELIAFYRPRGFRIDEVAGGFAFRTSPAFAPFVRDMAAKRPIRMTRAQLETLAIIAYRQPITRPEVDDVRGVDSGAVLKALLDRDLIRILGKRD